MAVPGNVTTPASPTTPGPETLDFEKATVIVEESEVDENTVWWDDENDGANPLNWPLWNKTVSIGFISVLTFVIPLATAAFSPAVPSVMEGFNETSKPPTNFVSSDST